LDEPGFYMHIIPKVKIISWVFDKIKIVFEQSLVSYSLIGGDGGNLQKLHHKISGLKFKITQADKIPIIGLESCQGAFHSIYTTLHDILLQNPEGNIGAFDTVIFSGQYRNDTTRSKRLQSGELVKLLTKRTVLPEQAFKNFFQANTSFPSYFSTRFYSSILLKLQ
jgi:hypothetical protein